MGAGEALPPRKAVAPASWADRNLNRKPIPRMDPREELARLVARGDIDLGEWLHRPPLVARPWTWYELEAARINAEQRAEVAERDASRFRTPNSVEEDQKARVIKYQRRAMVLALVAMVCFGLVAWFK